VSGLGCLIFCVIFGFEFFKIIEQPKEFQWDFKVRYYAGKTYSAGLTPYKRKNLNKISPVRIKHRFTSTPYGLLFYKAITRINPHKAYLLFLISKILIYLALVMLWRYKFFQDTNDILFFSFISLSIFSEAVFIDFLAGNITVIEQLLFWVGILFLVKRRVIISGFSIIFSAIFRFVNLFFLLFFLARGLYSYFFIFLIFAVLTVLAPFLILPIQANYFLKLFSRYSLVGKFGTPGHINPSSLNFFREIFGLNGNIIYICLAILVLAVSAFAIFRNFKSVKTKNYTLFFLIIVYCLIMPRLKDYYLIILLPPAYFLLDYCFKIKKYALFIVFFIIFFFLSPHPFHPASFKNSQYFSLMPFVLKFIPANFQQIIINYHMLISCYLLWISYIFLFFKKEKIQAK